MKKDTYDIAAALNSMITKLNFFKEDISHPPLKSIDNIGKDNNIDKEECEHENIIPGRDPFHPAYCKDCGKEL